MEDEVVNLQFSSGLHVSAVSKTCAQLNTLKYAQAHAHAHIQTIHKYHIGTQK